MCAKQQKILQHKIKSLNKQKPKKNRVNIKENIEINFWI